MYIAPSDPVEMYYISHNQSLPSEDVLAAKRAEMGLDKPFIQQYGNWLLKFLRGDMGVSYVDSIPVRDKIVEAMPYTLELAFLSLFLTMAISIPLGILTASKHNKWIDYIFRLFTFIISSIPSFVLSICLMFIFGVWLKKLPVISYGNEKGIILPALSLALTMSSRYIRQIRSTVLEELNKDYVLGARGRGVKESVILYKNVLKNTMITVVTLVGISLGSLLGGTAIIENIFVWPGMGKLALDSIKRRDYLCVQAFVVWMAFIFVFINFLTDLSYGLLDPRIKKSGK